MQCDCGHEAIPEGCTTGYGTDSAGRTFCFACAANLDRATMIRTGHSRNLPLYLSPTSGRRHMGSVGNWPGTLTFHVLRIQEGRHNIAGSRADVWFHGPDGHVWHGTQYGDWTQIVHCKRTAARWN